MESVACHYWHAFFPSALRLPEALPTKWSRTNSSIPWPNHGAASFFREDGQPPGSRSRERHVRLVTRTELDDAHVLRHSARRTRHVGRCTTRSSGRQSVGVSDVSAADQLVAAIHDGDVDLVERLVSSDAGLASSSLGGRHGTRTALHVVADWPGYWPNGPQIVGSLLAAGADPNARDPEPHSETPLHWAASSDDADVARALVDGGADVNLPDGSIGTPLDNAVGYGCWNVARLLVECGALVENLWVAAALGMLDRLHELVAVGSNGDREKVSQAFWHACNAGQRRAAEFLLAAGADLNWSPEYANGQTPLDAAQYQGTQQQNVISWLREQGARGADQSI